jgi:aryl-alcohol dehydrogenase-like predicted oxidoreductase
MKFHKLGRTGLDVSVICLGTMTWGQQNAEAEAHEQIDYALDAGVNFMDTAEMYPVPPIAETQGRTEEYIGTWFKKSGRRSEIVLATKAAGPTHSAMRPGHVRGGRLHHTRDNLIEAVNNSLQRLQTGYIDLYQLHWPDRSVNSFGMRDYRHRVVAGTVPIEETLRGLEELMKSGKVRHIGISNETPWGFSRYTALAEFSNLPRIASIQNPYSLVNRTFEIGHAEISMREEVGLLAYSPLAFGALSGKYLAGENPPAGRMTLFDRFTRYKGGNTELAAYEYVKLFRQYGIDPAQGALAFVNNREFITSSIVGATTMEQLRSNIASIDISLPEEVMTGIETIHTKYPNPAP